MLQQPKPGEPLYAQVNLEKKKKRQFELGVGQAGQVGGVSAAGSVGQNAAAGGAQWLADGVPQDGSQGSTVNVPPNSAAVSAGDSWV